MDDINCSDEVVMKVHLAELERESRKSCPDLNFLTQKLERTFAYRRSRVYNPELTVADVLYEFPALRWINCVSGLLKVIYKICFLL